MVIYPSREVWLDAVLDTDFNDVSAQLGSLTANNEN
jgi:hypothetical protein